MGIYSRDNLASGLQNALDAALRRRDEYVKQDAARRDANVEAINRLVKSIGYSGEDDLDERKRELLAEKAELQKAQEEESLKRSAEALLRRPAAQPMAIPVKSGFLPSEVASNVIAGEKPVPDYYGVMTNPVWNVEPEQKRSLRHYGFGDYMGVY